MLIFYVFWYYECGKKYELKVKKKQTFIGENNKLEDFLFTLLLQRDFF